MHRSCFPPELSRQLRVKCGSWSCAKFDFNFNFKQCTKCKIRRYCSRGKLSPGWDVYYTVLRMIHKYFFRIRSVILIKEMTCCQQCSRSRSGSKDPCLWLMDPDPAIFVIGIQDDNTKPIFFESFSGLLLFEGTFTTFFKDKKSKRYHKTIAIKFFLTTVALL